MFWINSSRFSGLTENIFTMMSYNMQPCVRKCFCPFCFSLLLYKKEDEKREKGQYKRCKILFHLNKHLEHNDFKCNFKIWIAFNKNQVVFKISEEYKDQPIQETYKKGQRHI